MTAKNCTIKRRGKQPSVDIGYTFTSRQGCTVKVIDYVSSKNVLIEYQDNFKYRVYVTAQNLRNGNFKNPYRPSIYGVGFFGVGKFKGFADGRPTPEYDAWHSMLSRCYNPSVHKSHPTYIDCSVCSEWQNFQTFAKWYSENEHYGLGYHLDKDILVKGNKVYSPKTCALVPVELNNLINDSPSKRGLYPVGVSYHKQKGRFAAALGRNKTRFEVGLFDCPTEAHKAYVLAKEAHVKEVVLGWKGRVDSRVFDALMVWTVN